MSAKVLWANHLRAQANNLNDLYERWELRREEEKEAFGDTETAAEKLPDYTNPSSVDEARRWRNDLIKIGEGIQSELTGLKAENGRGWHEYTRTQFYAKRKRLTAQLAFIRASMRMLKAYMTESVKHNSQSKTKQGKMVKRFSHREGESEEMADLRDLYRIFHEVFHFHNFTDIELTPEQKEILKHIGLKLKE